jgi:hypothetical protein
MVRVSRDSRAGTLHGFDVSFSVKNLSLFAFQAVAVFDSMWRV